MTQSPSDQLPPKPNAATAIMKRRADQRQRFDSADYAMALQQQQKSKRAPLPAPVRSNSDDLSDWVQCEVEPEPEAHRRTMGPPSHTITDPTNIPPQHVQRIRLQRFDSADWAMHLQHGSVTSNTDADASSPSVSKTVAKLMLDRHSYKTCNFVTTPIDPPPQRYLKNA